MDYELGVKKIITEDLSIYDGFQDKREAVIRQIVAALQSAYETGAADEAAKTAQQNKDSVMDVVAAEREACAKLAETHKSEDPIEVFAQMENAAALKIARAIRNRSVSASGTVAEKKS